MIRSMTAFVRLEQSADFGQLNCELKSVNHRYLEITLRFPESIKHLEYRIRDIINKQLNRGKIDIHLRYRPNVDTNLDFVLDDNLVKKIVDAGNAVGKLLPNKSDLNILELLKWPGVLTITETESETVNKAVQELVVKALLELIVSREQEGKRLKNFIEERCISLETIVIQLKKRVPELLNQKREKLVERIKELKIEIDQSRLEQEFVHLAQRIDINEEIDRLDSHIQEVRRLLQVNHPVGRRLDFLMQELNREANTVGSKSMDTECTRASVDLKVYIEQIREQVQNIE